MNKPFTWNRDPDASPRVNQGFRELSTIVNAYLTPDLTGILDSITAVNAELDAEEATRAAADAALTASLAHLANIGRQYNVDPAGGGDYTTISAAITAAAAHAPTALNPWLVLVRPGYYVENLDIPVGVGVVAESMAAVIVIGTITMHAGSSMARLLTAPPDDTFDYGWELVGDGADRIYVFNCYGQNNNTLNGDVRVVKYTGTTANQAYFYNCYLYARNKSTGGAARACVHHQQAGSKWYVEMIGGHNKTSMTLGFGETVLVWNQGSYSGTTVAFMSSDWEAFSSSDPIALRNENTAGPGAYLSVWTQSRDSDGAPRIIDVNGPTTTFGKTVLLSQRFRRVHSLQGYYVGSADTLAIDSAGLLVSDTRLSFAHSIKMDF